MIPSLRDVGETINIICGDEIMAENKLFRGGTVNELFDASELPDVSCILNLRRGPDKEFKGHKQIHIPAIDTIENYKTANRQVKNWANRVLSSLSDEIFPVLIHCTAGKDRTGVITALILLAIGIENDAIIEEYLQTQGAIESNIIQAIEGIGEPKNYIIDSCIIEILRSSLLNNTK